MGTAPVTEEGTFSEMKPPLELRIIGFRARAAPSRMKPCSELNFLGFKAQGAFAREEAMLTAEFNRFKGLVFRARRP